MKTTPIHIPLKSNTFRVTFHNCRTQQISVDPRQARRMPAYCFCLVHAAWQDTAACVASQVGVMCSILLRFVKRKWRPRMTRVEASMLGSSCIHRGIRTQICRTAVRDPCYLPRHSIPGTSLHFKNCETSPGKSLTWSNKGASNFREERISGTYPQILTIDTNTKHGLSQPATRTLPLSLNTRSLPRQIRPTATHLYIMPWARRATSAPAEGTS